MMMMMMAMKVMRAMKFMMTRQDNEWKCDDEYRQRWLMNDIERTNNDDEILASVDEENLDL